MVEQTLYLLDSEDPVHVVDWFPTLVKLSGAKAEQKLPLDGLDVWPVITEGAKTPHDAILLCAQVNRVAIRVGDWKATYLENRAHQLDVWREPFVQLRLPLEGRIGQGGSFALGTRCAVVSFDFAQFVNEVARSSAQIRSPPSCRARVAVSPRRLRSTSSKSSRV